MKVGARRYSAVRVENAFDTILIPVSTGKPAIPENILAKWQNSVNLITRILDVPTGIISCFTEQHLTVLITNADKSNPFSRNDSFPLGSGIFCETVAGRNSSLTVPDTNDSSYWKDNPLASTGMKAYSGVPICWEDSELFGTLCVLDNKTGGFPAVTDELLRSFGEIIESDLRYIMLNSELEKRLTAQEMLMREAHHRINNHFTILISYLQLQALEGKHSRSVPDLLIDIQNRIRSISVIHEELCRASAGSVMPPLNEYLSHLCNCLATNFTGVSLAIHCDVEPIPLPAERAVSIGLVIAELVTNSIKYAFSENTAPEISIRVYHSAAKRITIDYRDNGIGLPADFETRRSGSLGMNLIAMQIEQFHGEMQIGRGHGAQFRITIDE